MLDSVKAKDVMTHEVLVARADWSLQYLSEFFVEYAISGAPVVGNKGKLLGVVSTTDLVRFRALPVKNPLLVGPHRFYLEPHDEAATTEELKGLNVTEGESGAQVKDIMTYAVFNVDENDPLPAVINAIVRGSIHRVFVTSGDQLVGIVTALGLLEFLSQSNCFARESA
jgi:CBS domain-containing protein